MNSFLGYNTVSQVNPNGLAPLPRKSAPFPLETIDEDVAEAYEKIHRVCSKLEAALQNPVNKSPAKQKKLKSLVYKAKSSLKMIRDISIETSKLWF